MKLTIALLMILIATSSCSSKMGTTMDLASEAPNKEICGQFFTKEDPLLSHHVGTYCVIFKGLNK